MLSSFKACSRCLGHSLRMQARLGVPIRWQSTASSVNEALSPALLTRARSIAVNHAKLIERNTESYDVAVAKQIGELQPVTIALKEWDHAQDSIDELQGLLHDPASDNELRSLAESDIHATTALLPSLTAQLKTSLIPPHPFASLPCLIEIHPGAGGSEASLFAQSLLDMYTALCTRLGYPHTLVAYEADDSAPLGAKGLTLAVLEINQPGSYDLLRTEAGVHRVQRVPATEKKGRTHTSAVSVLVMPLMPDAGANDALNYDDPDSDYYVNSADVESETMRSSGAGGQHVNKTESAVRLTHVPSGIVIKVMEGRSQHKNREKAWQLLRAKLAQRKREEREEQMIALRRNVMGGTVRTGREDKIRTYNYSQVRVTDHRSGKDSSALHGLLAGEESLEVMMASVREWMDENEVKALIAEEEAKDKAMQTGK